MEEKLQNYRSKKRREAVINSFKDKFFNMVSFNQIKSDTKSDHVVETVNLFKSRFKYIINPTN